VKGVEAMKKGIQYLICFWLVMTIFQQKSLANEQSALNLDEVKSAILIDQHTGMIALDKNSHEPLSPASMTKIATMLLIMEAIESNTISWEDMVRTSEKAASMGGSQIFLKAGEEMTVRDMVKGIAIQAILMIL